MKIQSLVAGLFLFINSSIYAGLGSTRELIMFSEYGQNENIAWTFNRASSDRSQLGGVGAACGLLLTALHQEMPVLVPAPLWDTIVAHKKLFDAFTSLDLEQLHVQYRKYACFKGVNDISNFRQNCRYIKQRYEKMTRALASQQPRRALIDTLRQDPLFCYATAPDTIKRMSDTAWTEYLLYLMCSLVPVQKYRVKEIILPEFPEFPFYLFLPKTFFTENETEDEIGLKVHHFKDVHDVFAKRTYPRNARTLYPTLFVSVLRALFVTKNDCRSRPQRWSIFMMGHGVYADRERPSAIKDGEDGIIAGLSIAEFRNFLLFLENSIDTKLLFYSSCCSGGMTWLKVFSHHNQPLRLSFTVFADNLTEAPSISVSPTYRLDFFTDDGLDAILDWTIDWNKNEIAFDSAYDFSTFFATARNNGPCDRSLVDTLLYSLNPVHRCHHFDKSHRRLHNSEVNNITSVRLPLATSFRVIDDTGTFVPLGRANNTNIKSTTAHTSQKDVTIAQENDLVFLCDRTIPGSLTFLHDTQTIPFPSLVSLLPGKAIHRMHSIEAPCAAFGSIVKSFFPCQKLAVSKLFFVPRLRCAASNRNRKSVELHDVAVFNHIPASVIDGFTEHGQEECYYNGIIAYNRNQPIIFVWDSSDPVPRHFAYDEGSATDDACLIELFSFFEDTINRNVSEYPVITVDELSCALS